MKTIAVRERTFQVLKELKTETNARSFDELLYGIAGKKKKIPESMFGALKGKIAPFTRKDREELWNDPNRE